MNLLDEDRGWRRMATSAGGQVLAGFLLGTGFALAWHLVGHLLR